MQSAASRRDAGRGPLRLAKRWGRVLWLSLYGGLAHGGELLQTNVEHVDERYTIVSEVRIAVPVAAVRQMLMDLNHLDRINRSIEDSKILHVYSEGHYRVRTVINACVLFYCKRMVQVQDVQQLDDGDIVATVVPGLSDFRYGVARWTLRQDGDATRLRFDAEVEPSFWIPPLIGPWLIGQKFHSEALESAENMERLAQGDPSP
jgi:hypothetical protein